MSLSLLYVGASIITVLGLVHFAATKAATREYRNLPPDLQREHLVQWLAVGIALVFVGVATLIALTMGDPDTDTFSVVIASFAGFVTAVAITDTIIYRKSKMIPHKTATAVLVLTSLLYILGTVL